VGGFLAGKNTSPAAAETTESAPTQRTRSQSRPEVAGNETKRSGTRARSTDEIYRAPGQTNRIQALMDFYAGLSPEQLEAEAGKLDDLPMSERMVASFLLFGKWAETDPLAAMAYTTKMGFGGNFVKPTILQSWASVDPAGAAKYYMDNPREFAAMGMMGGGRGPMGGGNGASTIASEWARQDPQAAMAWASTLTGNDKGSAMTAVVREVANSDPSKAWGMVATMDKESQTRAYEDIAGKWGSKNFTEAEAMISTLPADQQAAAMSSAIAGLSKSDPKLAAAKAAAMPAGEDRDDAISTVARNWSRESPKEAATWILTQSDDEAKSDAIGEIMPNWVSQDEKGALSFITAQQPGAVRDRAAASYVMTNRTGSPAEVIKIAESITDEDSRNQSIRVSAIRWMQEDAAAANTYIQSSDAFSDEMKTRAAAGQPLWGGGRGGPGGPGGGLGGR
jgi:hypothetical protein